METDLNKKIPIKNWPKSERPREKLIKKGEHNLTNAELLAILIGTGNKKETALDIARKILKKYKSFRNISKADTSTLKKVYGLGIAKITKIKAAIEIGRRLGEERMEDQKIPIKNSKDVADMLMNRMRDLNKEVFKILLLDAKNKIIENIEIEEGLVNQAKPYIRTIFEKAFQFNAVSIICAHNHPSGDPTPSIEDRVFTKKIVELGKSLNVSILDHIIIGNNKYFSFADEGEIK